MRWALLVLAALAACGRGADVIVVGSKNFTEQRILGELLAQTVESVGLRAERKLDLGGTFVCDAAIRAGQIDMYVEYTGTALAAILKEKPEGVDRAQVLARVREAALVGDRIAVVAGGRLRAVATGDGLRASGDPEVRALMDA